MPSIKLYIVLVCAKLVANQHTTTPGFYIHSGEYNASTTDDYSTTDTEDYDMNKMLCSPRKSLHTAKDISALIDYVLKNRSLVQIIHSNYTAQAKKVAERHLNNIKLFEEWMEERPPHLLHILQDLANFRNCCIEPVVDAISTEMDQNPRLLAEFQARVELMQNYLREFDNYENICKHCRRIPVHRVKRSIDEKSYYCSSLGDLYGEIASKTLLSVRAIKTELQLILDNIDMVFTNKVAITQKKIKEAALASFSKEMYEILNLQDEYHHFYHDTSKMNVSEELFSIKKIGYKIDAKLLTVSRAIRNYDKKCRKCKIDRRGHHRTYRQIDYQKYTTADDNNDTRDENKATLVDALIKIKSVEIREAIKEDINAIFQPLNEILVNLRNRDNFRHKIEHIKEKVEKARIEENTVFVRLKNLVPQSSIKAIVHLLAESQELLQQMEEMEQKLNASINSIII